MADPGTIVATVAESKLKIKQSFLYYLVPTHYKCMSVKYLQ